MMQLGAGPVPTQPEGKEQGQPEGRILTEVRGKLEADRKSERGDKKPEEPAPEKEERDSNQRADDGQGEIHARSLAMKKNHGQSMVG